jgi:type IV pilus assembly protein PilY1
VPSAQKGWFYNLNSSGTNSGEKVVSSPVTLNGVSYFNTNRPTPATCGANLGEARIYALDYLSGKASVYKDSSNATLPSAFSVVKGGGYLPTGVPAVVNVGGKLREVLIVGTKVSQDIGIVQLGRRVRTYWFQGIDQ